MKKSLIALAACLAATSSFAQPPSGSAAPAAREDGLDPTPVNPATDPDTGRFLNDYRNAKPRFEYGKLAFHDILTRLDAGADPVRPARRGAVLTAIKAISYVTLAPGATVSGRARAGERQSFLATAGTGTITSAGKSHAIADGSGFTLTPDFDFTLTNTGKTPMAFYVRTEPLPAGVAPTPALLVMSRFNNDRRVGAHWMHICNGGPTGLNLCTIAPYTMPQPHSHAGEEIWIMVKGQTILSLGKSLVRMGPGQAYKIPPTGLAAHSNINMSDEPVQMIFVGPASQGGPPPAAPATGAPPRPANVQLDFARLDNSPINQATGHDVDMYMGSWRDAYPRIGHGNLYFRDMLTALQGPDALRPTRKGAVLVNAEAVSYAMLEPGSTAHKIDGELKGIQETFIVNSGSGYIISGGKRVDLAKDMAFVITPGLDFRMTATGEKSLTFYVISEKIPPGVTPKTALEVIDNRARPQVTNAWYNKERPLISKSEGLTQYGAITQVELPGMSMARPTSNPKGGEEIWIATDNDIDMLFGKQLRKLPAGTAYSVPPTGITARANINMTNRPARFLYMVK
jgi:mannose-6-phosphate isomerase-like protein (cupin superfamily)